jgi:hypothetical protein
VVVARRTFAGAGGWRGNWTAAPGVTVQRSPQRKIRVGLALSLGWAITTVFFSGCGGNREPERVIVSGTITYQGKSITAGQIRFVPVRTSGMPASGAFIENGKYRADGRGGVPIGTSKVEIDAFRPVSRPGQPAAAVPVLRGRQERVQYLPRQFNVDSQLKITIEPGSKEITKDFDLKD